MFTTTEIYIEEGCTVKLEQLQIIPGVTLKVFNDDEGVLVIGNDSIEFDFCEDSKAIFSDIDNANVIELLSVLAAGITKFNKVEAVA